MTDGTAPPVTVEEFMESMRKWINVSIYRSVRRGSATFSREDLMQDARCALLEVARDYPEKFAAGALDELQKIGRRAIFFHTGNLYYKARSDHSHEFTLLPLDEIIEPDHSGGKPRNKLVNQVYRLHGKQYDVALDRLIIREEVEQIVASNGAARCAFQYATDPCPAASWGRVGDTRPALSLPSAGAMRIFRQVKKKVKCALLRDGYMKVSAVRPQKGDNTMLDSKTGQGPTSPDAPVTTAVAAEVEAVAVRRVIKKAVKKTAKDGATAKARLNAAETAKKSSAFTKGQKVTYVGNGRASWLKAGTTLEVKGTVVSRGRTYVRCFAVNAKRKVSLSSALLKK